MIFFTEMRKTTFLFLISNVLFQCASLQTQEPFFKAGQPLNLSADWTIELTDLGFYRKVEDDWWGEDFYVATFKISNQTEMYKFFNLCDDKLKESNFDYILKVRPELNNIYQSNPEKFDKVGFLNGKPEMKLVVEISDPVLWPTATYNKMAVFPKLSQSKPEFAAAMTSCRYGIPMSRDTDRGRTSTGWVPPKGSSIVRTIYSIPKGSKFLRFEQQNYFNTNLEKVEK